MSKIGFLLRAADDKCAQGTHKVFKGGYSDNNDLSPVWVGRCKGKQKCDAGKQGGTHDLLLDALGNDLIFTERCMPVSEVVEPDCTVSTSRLECDNTFIYGLLARQHAQVYGCRMSRNARNGISGVGPRSPRGTSLLRRLNIGSW
jgi:hypothetical protein